MVIDFDNSSPTAVANDRVVDFDTAVGRTGASPSGGASRAATRDGSADAPEAHGQGHGQGHGLTSSR